MRETAARTYQEFEDERHFRTLDGVRAVAILLVIASHMPEPWWQGLNGFAGVTLFFGLSGFLITTLCLREEAVRGRVSLLAFYARRTFRIFPLYYLILGLYAVLITTGVLDGREQWNANLPHYLTYTNELVTQGHYRHTWSLGVEEKFYLLWPLIAFAILRVVPAIRLHIAVAITLAVMATNQLGVISYDIGLYGPILMGCCLALALQHRSLFAFAARTASIPGVVATVVTAFVVLHFLQEQLPSAGSVYAALGVAVIGLSIVSRGPLSALLSWRGWRLIAERSYAMYLIHALVMRAVSVPFGGHTAHLPVPLALLRLMLTTALCLVLAEGLWRVVERPLIRVGKNLSKRIQEGTSSEPVGAA